MGIIEWAIAAGIIFYLILCFCVWALCWVAGKADEALYEARLQRLRDEEAPDEG